MPTRLKDRAQLRHTHGAANIVARHRLLSRDRHQRAEGGTLAVGRESSHLFKFPITKPNPWIFSRQALILPRFSACHPSFKGRVPRPLKCPSPTILTLERCSGCRTL